jgi:cystathionine beta-lyase
VGQAPLVTLVYLTFASIARVLLSGVFRRERGVSSTGMQTTSLELLSADELRARSGRKWHEYAEDVVPAWVAEMDFEVAEPIRMVLRRIAGEAAYGYEESWLYPTLAEAFAEYMRQRFGWQVGSEHVVPVADLVQALFTGVTAFTEPGQGVVLQTPIYPPFQMAVRETGRRIVESPLIDNGQRFRMDPDSLAVAFDARAPLLLLCNPHNPTGRAFERAELEAIAAVAVARLLVVIADEVHADLVYSGHQHIPFASLGAEVAGRTVTITSATKAYNIPGLRCGVMHFGSSALREQFRKAVPDRMLGIANRFGIEATLVAWRECGGWLNEVLGLLEKNRAHMEAFLARELPGVRWYPPEATYLAWLDYRGVLPADVVPQRYLLDNARVALSDGTDFGPGGEGRARLNFGTSPLILETILSRLAESLKP